MSFFLINHFHNDYFGNRDKVDTFQIIHLCSIGVDFTAYLHAKCGDVSSFARKIIMFCAISTFVFRVINSGGVF